MKNKLFQLGDSLLRILDSSGDLVLVIDCAKQTMPVWISVSDIALYKPISSAKINKHKNTKENRKRYLK